MLTIFQIEQTASRYVIQGGFSHSEFCTKENQSVRLQPWKVLNGKLLKFLFIVFFFKWWWTIAIFFFLLICQLGLYLSFLRSKIQNNKFGLSCWPRSHYCDFASFMLLLLLFFNGLILPKVKKYLGFFGVKNNNRTIGCYERYKPLTQDIVLIFPYEGSLRNSSLCKS